MILPILLQYYSIPPSPAPTFFLDQASKSVLLIHLLRIIPFLFSGNLLSPKYTSYTAHICNIFFPSLLWIPSALAEKSSHQQISFQFYIVWTHWVAQVIKIMQMKHWPLRAHAKWDQVWLNPAMAKGKEVLCQNHLGQNFCYVYMCLSISINTWALKLLKQSIKFYDTKDIST